MSVLGKTETTVFFPNMDRPRPANNVFIFFFLWENTLNICADFLLNQFHTVRVRLACFLRLHNKIHFRYDSCHYPNHKCLTFCPIFSCTFPVLQNAAKIAAILENSERSVRGVRMGKSGPLERAELANQIQGFGIPDH